MSAGALVQGLRAKAHTHTHIPGDAQNSPY